MILAINKKSNYDEYGSAKPMSTGLKLSQVFGIS